jgi:hypothetical protein
MGTHPSCPSTLLDTKENLKEYLKTHPELLGDKVVKHFGDDLPFLFKVSSRENARRERDALLMHGSRRSLPFARRSVFKLILTRSSPKSSLLSTPRSTRVIQTVYASHRASLTSSPRRSQPQGSLCLLEHCWRSS